MKEVNLAVHSKMIPSLALLVMAGSLTLAPTVEGQCELVKLTPATSASLDFMGASIDMNGPVAIVGAFGSDVAATDAGAAYVYRYNGVNWAQEAVLTAGDAGISDRFGISVAIEGDVAIVGSYLDDDLGTNSGSAYIFRRNATTGAWAQEAKLTAGDGAANDRFGISVALNGGVGLVGSYFNDGVAVNSGAAYVYRYDGGANAWNQEAKLTAGDGAVDDSFGVSVALSEGAALIGAYRHDSLGTNAGAAYVYRYDAGGLVWNQEAKLTAGDGAAEDRFGFSVALDGGAAVLGSYLDDDGGVDSGSAYVFRYDAGASVWNQEAKLTAGDGAAGDNFGVTVDLSGELVIVGSYLNDALAADAGAAYTFLNGVGWAQDAKLTASDGSAFDRFGIAVAASGRSAMVGAYFNDQMGLDAGAPYVYGGLLGSDCNSNGVLDSCEIANGLLVDANANQIPDLCEPYPCPADCAPQNPDGTWGDGAINIQDLVAIINNFGSANGPCDFSPANPDGSYGDGVVNIMDLISLINNFGVCSP